MELLLAPFAVDDGATGHFILPVVTRTVVLNGRHSLQNLLTTNKKPALSVSECILHLLHSYEVLLLLLLLRSRGVPQVTFGIRLYIPLTNTSSLMRQ